MTVMVQTCLESDYDAATQVCTVPIWTPQESFLPTLDLASAKEIGFAIALLWATAYVLRMCRKALQEIG